MYKKFEKLCKQHKVNPSSVATATGIPRSTFSDWKTDRSVPKADKIMKIAEYFGVPMEYFYKE